MAQTKGDTMKLNLSRESLASMHDCDLAELVGVVRSNQSHHLGLSPTEQTMILGEFNYRVMGSIHVSDVSL